LSSPFRFRVTVLTHVAFGRFLFSVRDCGTLCPDCCVTLAATLLGLYFGHSLKTFFSLIVLVHVSALGTLAIVRYTNPVLPTYLLSDVMQGINR